MATTTPNLGLRKPAGSDLVSVLTDISNNMDTIDNLVAPKASPTFTGTVTMAGLTATGAFAHQGSTFGVFNVTPAAQIAGNADVLAGLVTHGFRAASSNPPLNLGTSALLSAGKLALGIAQDPNVLLYVNQTHPSNSTVLYSIYNDVTYPATATTGVKNFHSKIRTAAGSYTMAFAYNIDLIAPAYGASSVITEARGVSIADHGASNVATAIGLYVGAQRNSTVANIGVKIDAALNTGAKTLWVSGNTDSTVPAAGIYFGASGDTIVYRLAAASLAITGKLNVSGNFGCNGVAAPAQPAQPTKPAATAATAVTPFGYTTAAQADAIVTAVNAIIDVLHNNGVTA